MPSAFHKEQLKVGGGYGAAATGTSPAGGLTIGEAGDIATDGDLTVDGTLSVADLDVTALDVTGGSAAIGVDGVTRGALTLHNGAGSTTPGVMQYTDLAGVLWYVWVDITGGLRRHSSLPTADSDGEAVAKVHAAHMKFLDNATPSTVTIAAAGTWVAFAAFAAGVDTGSEVVSTVDGVDDFITVEEAGDYAIEAWLTAEPGGNNQDVSVGVGIDGSAPTALLSSAARTLSNGAFGFWGLPRTIATLSAGDVLRLYVKNDTSTNDVDVAFAHIYVEHLH